MKASRTRRRELTSSRSQVPTGSRATTRPVPRPSLLEVEPLAVELPSTGFYVRHGKRWAALGLLAVVGLPSLAVGLVVFVVNTILFRSPRLAFYRQERVGHQGRVFRIVKFRTMRPLAESKQGETDASRITRFGRFLRVTHLDELPQLLHVLRGEMSFVGPRPEMVSIHHWASATFEGFADRNRVLPGLTGWAQITEGYAEVEEQAYRRKLAADRHYLAQVSPTFDLWILLRTALWMVGLRGRLQGR